ncbi:hypothetical protein [Streptomyces koyangensis]
MVLGHSLGGVNAYRLDTGHTVHDSAPEEFAGMVRAFLVGLV